MLMVIFAVLKGDWLGVVDFEIRMLTAAATSSTSPTNSARLPRRNCTSGLSRHSDVGQ